jgi:5-methylcytosine-specific restriction endonuclease McrA
MNCKKDEPFWAKKNIDKWSQLKFNINFLKKIDKKNKGLHCEYCGKKNLRVYDWCEKTNLDNVATVDHFYPKSKFEYLKKEEKNFVISCYECNNKKRDKLWEIEKIKYPLNNNKIIELKKIV